MSKLNKKILSVGLAVTTLVWLSGTTIMIPQAKAATTEELQAQIALLLAQIQALQAQLGTGTGTGTGTSYNFTRDLTLGSKGDDVKALQQWLNANGYQVAASGAGSTGNETTFFGPATKAALAKYQAAKGISPAAGYFGPKTRAALGTGGVVIPPVVPPVGSGLTITLAADNPAAATVPRGANAIPFLKLNVYGNGTLDSLNFKRVGIGATGDFESAGINLYDGTTRLTSGKSINSTTHEVNFVNLALAVSGTKTLTLTGNTATSSTAGDVNGFNLIGATGSPTPTGFPVSGNGMVVGGATVGTVTIDDSTAPTNPNIGQTEALLLEVQVTAGSAEDIEIQKIAFTEGGTVQNSYLTNFKLKYLDTVVATANAVGAKDLITFDFTTPYKLEKGQSKNFKVYGDISGAARSSDTVILYVDNIADVVAKGLTYGYSVTPTISSVDTSSESDTLTLQGANITMTFKGPVAGDVALRGQDVNLFEFDFTTKNNIEIKNFRFSATTTGLIAGEGFMDFKLWDAVSNTVLTSATDVTTTTAVTFTDTINVSANQSKKFKITADIDADNDSGDNILVRLLPFESNDIRNLDNSTYVTPSTDVSPNATVTGNTQTVKSPGIFVSLAGSPSSQTYVQGTTEVPFVGMSLKAEADDMRITQIKVYASSTSGTLTSGEIQNLALYVDGERIGDIESLDSSLTATFNNFSKVIPKGSEKVFTVKANIATDAGNTEIYFVYLNALADITASDSQGNAFTPTGATANSGQSVLMTIANVGSITVAAAPQDNETKADIILANGAEQTLGKFVLIAANENMTLKNIAIMVSASSSATATSTTTGDDVPWIKLYDGSAPIGGPFYPAISGASSSIVQIENLNWLLPKDTNKTLTVKGLVNTIGNGADTGADVFTHILATGFKASGSTADDTTITAASGNRKVIYKSRPTLSLVSPQPNTGNGSLTGGTAIKVLRFRISADANGAIAWRTIQFQVGMTNATMSAASATNVVLRKVSTAESLTLATVYSGLGFASSTTTSTVGGNTGYVGLEITTHEQIAAGSYQDYDLELTFADISTTNDAAQAVVKLYRQESNPVNATWYAGTNLGGAETMGDMNPSFIWSDQSVVGVSATTTGDWANGVYVLPTLFTDVSNVLTN